jgi:hypothetical protein
MQRKFWQAFLQEEREILLFVFPVGTLASFAWFVLVDHQPVIPTGISCFVGLAAAIAIILGIFFFKWERGER